MHNHGVQGVMGMDGLFYDIYDGKLGRHNDKRFMKSSQVNNRLRIVQLGAHRQFIVYTDKGYFFNTHVRCAAHGPGEVTELQRQHNEIMSMYRVGVEWGFGRVKARVPYLSQSRLLKLRAYDVGMRVKVGFILTNIHTCMHGSQSGLYFGCAAPTVEQYLNFL